MRVLALLTDGFGAGGGIARYNQAIMTAVSRCDCISEVTILPRFGVPEGALPASIVQSAPSAGRLAWSARAVAEATRRKFDLIFCGHLNATPLASAIAGVRRIPLWVQVHGIEAWSPRDSVTRKGLESATLVTAVSRYTRKRLLEWSCIAPERVRVLPNTFAADFTPRAGRAELASRLGIADKRVVLTVGRLAAGERYKGHDRIIRALPSVLESVPDAVYLIVGSGDDLPRLRQLAEWENVAGAVVFASHVSESELPDYYALADLFAMPSTGEGFGIVFLEAVASGLPVIGGNRDGSVDALADGAIGRVIDPHDPEELASALVDALRARVGAEPERVERFAFANFARHVDRLLQVVMRL